MIPFTMRFFRFATFFLGLALMGIGATGCRTRPTAEPADLILHNGMIWTADPARPEAQAVAIRGEDLIAVGRDPEVLRLRGPRTRVINVRGRFVVPGFNDSHTHFAAAARFLEFNLMKMATQEEFVARVRDLVAQLPTGEWILGGYWGAYDRWAPGSAGGQHRAPFQPDMRRIEALTRDQPVFIWNWDRSEYAANRAALRAAGLDPDRPPPPGIEFVYDAQGRWTGRMRGAGVWPRYEKIMPHEFSHQRRIQQTLRALAEIRRFGVTSISDMSDDAQRQIFRELRDQGELTVRVHFRYPLDRWQELAERGIRIGSGDEWIRLGALKGHIDGIMGTHTARFFEPYQDDPSNRGRWRRLIVDETGNFAPDRFLGLMLAADRAGLQLSVHAIGDEANHLLLNFLDQLERRTGKKDRRFRLVHAQVIAPPDFPRLGRLGVLAEVQPYHLADDMRWMEERIGHERCKGAYAFRSIMENGAILVFGSDWPGTSASEYPINPLFGIYAAVTRQTLTGQPPGGWFPEQRISLEDALRAYTYNGAYASFEEDIKGSITVGKRADLTVLSHNLLTARGREILDTKVLLTIVGGRVVYEKTE